MMYYTVFITNVNKKDLFFHIRLLFHIRCDFSKVLEQKQRHFFVRLIREDF